MNNFKTFYEDIPDSYGILLYYNSKVFIVHPVDPKLFNLIRLSKNPIEDPNILIRSQGKWTIPKGKPNSGEKPIETAKREFEEETGINLGKINKYDDLGIIQYRSGKIIKIFKVEGTGKEKFIKSNLIDNDYLKGLPENDFGGWFEISYAKKLLHPEQAKFLDRI